MKRQFGFYNEAFLQAEEETRELLRKSTGVPAGSCALISSLSSFFFPFSLVFLFVCVVVSLLAVLHSGGEKKQGRQGG